jgi:chitin synthase
MIVYSNSVLDLKGFFDTDAKLWDISNEIVENLKLKGGSDATMSLSKTNQHLIRCLRTKYTIGYIVTETIGCSLYSTFNTIALVVILGLVLVRFIMAFGSII